MIDGLSLGGSNILYAQIIVWVVLSCVEYLQSDVSALGISNAQVNFIFWFWLYIDVGGWQLDPAVEGLANMAQVRSITCFCIACQIKMVFIFLNGQNKDSI